MTEEKGTATSQTLRDYLSIAFRRKRYFVVPLVIGVVVTVVAVVTMEPAYTAEALVRRRDYGVIRGAGNVPLTVQTQATSAMIQTEIMMRDILKPVARRLWPEQTKDILTEEEDASPVMDQLLERLGENLEISATRHGPGVDYVTIAAKSKDDPKWCAAAANALARTYEERFQTFDESTIESELQFLEEQVRKYRQRLHEVQDELARFEKEHIESLPQQRGTLRGLVLGLRTQATDCEVGLKAAKEKVEHLQGRLETVPEVVVAERVTKTNPEVQRLQEDIDALEATLAQLLVRMTEEHPTIKGLHSQIEAKKDKLAQLPATVVDSETEALNPEYLACKADLEAAHLEVKQLESTRARLEGEIEAHKKRAEGMLALEQEHQTLIREEAEWQDQYAVLSRQLEAAKTRLEQVNPALPGTIQKFGTEVKVLQEAVVPVTRPKGPQIKLLFVGLAASIFLGIGLVSVAEFVDNSFRGFDDVSAALSIPILGVLPVIETEQDVQRRASRKRSRRLLLAAALVLAGSLALVVYLYLAGEVGPETTAALGRALQHRIGGLFDGIAGP